MGDNDDLDLDGSELHGTENKAKKTSGIGALLPNILKFVAIGLAAVIFIVTVVVITFNIINNRNKSQTSTIDTNSPYEGRRPEYAFYTLIGQVSTKTSDAQNYTVTVEMIIGYDQNDNAAGTELTQRQHELRDFVRRYFAGKTAAELGPENEIRLKNDIKEILNTRYLDKARVRTILFNKLDVMEVY